MSKSSKPPGEGLPVINPAAAAIDVGSRFHAVGVPPALCDQQACQSFTGNLQCMGNWLKALGITPGAMESTGVYWVAIYEDLETFGIEVIVANAREARAVPRRKSDVNDAQWLQRLHPWPALADRTYRPPHLEGRRASLQFDVDVIGDGK